MTLSGTPRFLPDCDVCAQTSPLELAQWTNFDPRPTVALTEGPTDRERPHAAARRPHHPPQTRRRIVTSLDVPRLETSATTIGGADAIAVAGELDMETAPRLSEQVEIAVWNSV